MGIGSGSISKLAEEGEMTEIKVVAVEKGIKIDWMSLSKVDGLLTPKEARELSNEIAWMLFEWVKLTGQKVDMSKCH